MTEKKSSSRKTFQLRLPTPRQNQDFEPIAELITSGPPQWLTEHLKVWSSSVFLGRAVERRQPTRAEMRQLLLEISNAAAVLQRALNEPSLLDYLNMGADVPIEAPFKLQLILADLHRRAARARNSSSLVDPQGKTLAGRGPAMPEGAISAQAFCALLIAETWKWFRGKYPAPRNKEAAKAIDLYWRLAGGEKQSWGNDPLASWRSHLKKALEAPTEKERAEIRRHLNERKRITDLPKPDLSGN